MTWHAAHIVMYTKFLDGVQDTYPVWENIVMIEAATSDEAFEMADRKGSFDAEVSEDSWYTYNGRPAVWVFAGVRKLNECIENFDPEQRGEGGVEEDGTEVTYSTFLLENETALQRFVSNKTVAVLYEGREDDEQ